MKSSFLGTVLPVLFFCLLNIKSLSQESPATFHFTSKKIATNQYEIHISAKIRQPWHIYAQVQPKGSINIPTLIKFKNNPLIIFDGKVKEVGTKEYFNEKSLNISSWLYHNNVEFIQIIHLKVKTNTNIIGSITFQVCNEKVCLQPTTLPFNIVILNK